MLTRVWALALIAGVLASAHLGAAARVQPAAGSTGEFEVGAVLVMILGPGEGLIGLDPDSRVDFPYVLPATQRVLVRATITDANGVGVNGRVVTGTLTQPEAGSFPLNFTQNTVSGVYTSNALAYAGSSVAFHVSFDLTPEIVDKTYVPLPLPGAGLPETV